jgi:hypothetical protein
VPANALDWRAFTSREILVFIEAVFQPRMATAASTFAAEQDPIAA